MADEHTNTQAQTYPPSPEVTAYANAKADLYEQADRDFEGFWGDQARKYVTWSKDFDQVLDWSDAPFAKWFVGGELNVAVNCVDRHVDAGHGDRAVPLSRCRGRGRPGAVSPPRCSG